jgi:hypothetical protein
MSPSSDRRLLVCAVAGMHMIQQNFLLTLLRLHRQQEEANREPRRAQRRLSSPKSVEKIYGSMGAELFHRVYRMTYGTFETLAGVLQDAIERVLRDQDNKGDASLDLCYYRRMGHKVCLAVALGYFGGSLIQDLMYAFKVRRKVAEECILLVVNAIIDHCPQLQFFYPTDQEKQREIAKGFQQDSGFEGCAGCIESIFLSYQKPANFDFDDPSRFFCSRKNRHGLHCHMMCDVQGKFCHISLGAGAFSDARTFRRSYLGIRNDLFAPGLRLVGGAFLSPVPKEYLAIPLENEENDSPRMSIIAFIKQFTVKSTVPWECGCIVGRFSDRGCRRSLQVHTLVSWWSVWLFCITFVSTTANQLHQM